MYNLLTKAVHLQLGHSVTFNFKVMISQKFPIGWLLLAASKRYLFLKAFGTLSLPSIDVIEHKNNYKK